MGPLIQATMEPQNERKTLVRCSLSAEGIVCVTGEVLAVRVPSEWMAV